ncbi:MAG: DUF839 domain-containing protein, partial [Actinomycetota bacterium]|nr:DUF839 domain-containing protein [Actinomycetota bacterium]
AFDGAGEWIPLTSDRKSYVPGFSVEEVLVHTRLAADTVRPTKMDRPEDIEPNPVTGTVYCSLTNNTKRTAEQVDEANPRAANKHGQVLEISERGNDPTATRFAWTLLIVAGDPTKPDTYYGGYDTSQVSPMSAPDNVAFDPSGHLWVTTDGNELGFHDGLYAVPTRGRERGHARLFMTVPEGAEATGPVLTADGLTALLAVQHPGEAEGSTAENPASTFPYGGRPRPTVVVVWRTGPGSPRIGA